MKLGTIVKNERGWTGTIVERPRHWTWKNEGGRAVVYVHWQEREAMMQDGRSGVNDPVVSAIPETLTIVG